VRPYEYKDAGTLLADFWSAVDEVLRCAHASCQAGDPLV